MRPSPRLACALLLLLGGVSARAQELPFTHYTTEDPLTPLPKAAVTAALQDGQGYLWVANYGAGLLRYDGRSFDLYTPEDGLGSTSIWNLQQDGAGRLWMQTDAGLEASERPLQAFETDERVRFTQTLGEVSLPTDDSAGWARRIATDAEGRLWFLSPDEQVLRYTSADADVLTVDTLALPAGLDSTSFATITRRRGGGAWISTRDGRLVSLRGDGEPAEMLPSPPCGVSDVLYEAPGGTLWGGCRNGLVWRMTEPAGAPAFETVAPQSGLTVTAIVEDEQGDVWVASLGGGLVRLPGGEPDRAATYGLTNGLLDMNVWGLVRDREGNYWISGNTGLSKLRHNFAAFGHFTGRSHTGEQPVLPAADVISVLPPAPVDERAPDEPAMLVAGTSAGLAFIREDGRAEHLLPRESMPDLNVLSLCRDGDRNLWLTTRQGAARISFDPSAPLPLGSTSVESISIFDRPARLAFYAMGHRNTCRSFSIPVDPGSADGERVPAVCFSGNGLLCLVRNEWFHFFGEAAGLPPVMLWAVLPDAEGVLYAGTRGDGLHRSREPLTVRYLDDHATPAAASARIPHKEITQPFFRPVESLRDSTAHRDVTPFLWHEGRLWATGDSLLVLGEEPMRLLQASGKAAGIADNIMSLGFSPRTGTLWGGTGLGLLEIDPENGTTRRHLTKADGLGANVVWGVDAVGVGEDGTLYYGTSSGLSLYRPHLDRPNTVPPTPQFRTLQFSQDAWGQNELRAEFAALSFANEKEVAYRTRLVGYDADWSAPGPETRTRYTNLGAFFLPKTYTFEVAAANDEGVWTSAPLAYTFSVAPPWWYRWWAFGIYAVLLAVGVVAVDRVQRRRLIARERERAQLREAELRAETAELQAHAAELQARVMQAENEQKEAELQKAQDLERAYTALSTAHRDLKATQQQLIHQEKLASLGRVTAGIAHEIKNPLNFVNNFAALAEELAEELREALEAKDADETEAILSDLTLNATKIREHGGRADAIVRSMMAHASGAGAARQRVHLNELVEDHVGLAYHGRRAQEPGFDVRLVRDYGEDVGEVELAPQEIGRVVINLVSNAFDAVRDAAAARGDGSAMPTVRVVTRREADEVVIRVEDNGPGIPEPVRAKIFEPFFTTKPTGSGTGLGLSMSYDIVVQGHGGALDVDSAADEGATFTVRLPASHAPASHPPAEAIIAGAEAGTRGA